MALKKAGSPAPAAPAPDQIPEVPTAIPRDRWDRPLITPPGGGRPVAYTRASTLGKALTDDYHLSRWLQRNVALGLSRRPDLVALAAAIRTNEGDDRGPLDEIAEKAHEAAKGDKGANVGTALHKLSERRDAGEDLSYLPDDLMAALDAYSRCMAAFRVLATETFVVYDGLQTAGTFDRVVVLLVDLKFSHPILGEVVIPAGTVLVLDLKTGKVESAKYWDAVYAVQQFVYGHGVPYDAAKGRRAWADILGPGNEPSKRWALILHVPSDSPKDAGLVVVDLEIGEALAELATEVRRARKVKGLFSDAFPVDPPGTIAVAEPAQVAKLGLIAQLRQAPDEAALNALWEQYQAEWNEDATRMVRARLAELGAA
jgi:hypothetical protein